MSTGPFADLPTIGELSLSEAAAKLREFDEESLAEQLEQPSAPQTFAASGWWPFRDRAWQHTAHAFGFLPIDATGGSKPISGIGSIQADQTLKNSQLKITLNRLRIADYPGRGIHRILVDFYGRNQVPGQTEDLHFNATYRAREGERAAVIGYPIFVGINAGAEGLAFHCHTVNVKNDNDEGFLNFLEGDVFKAGLKLATSAQPAIAPLTSMALGITKAVAQRHRNVSVQDFYLGLDFTGTTMGARLAQGDYIAVQVPESMLRVWRWDDWLYDVPSGMIVAKEDPDQLIPYNYLVFGISRYDGT